MSGIVGFINLDGEPASPEVLLKISRPLAERAPDGTNVWQQGSTGLGHSLLATSSAATKISQPYSQDGAVWVTSDAHLYGKEELIKKIRSTGAQITADLSEPELLIWAYHTFGEAFGSHLIGDFAVAIWDEDHKKLICVRDHLGVRPLFYAHTNGKFIFSSDIDSLLAHPKLSVELNEEYIADFLLFGLSVENDATAYKHIKRIPAAHYLVVDASGIRSHRYWSPPTDRVIRYTRPDEYTDHFASLFEKAVTERIPSTQVALELSGGMDSASIAAVAAAHCGQNKGVTAYTNTCNTLIPKDKEGRYAKMIAAHLNIPLHLLASENYPLFDRFDAPVLRTAEPYGNPDLAQHYDKAKHIVDSGCRVLLTGQMGDTLFAGSYTYFPHLIKSGRLVRLMTELSFHKKNVGSLKGTGLRTAMMASVRNIMAKKPSQPGFPNWLNSEFSARTKIGERWHAIWQMWDQLNDTKGQLQRPWFCRLFEDYEALKLPLLVRHPFTDIRLVEYTLSIPSFMLYNKRVLREAMQRRLPAEITSRPKEGLPGDLRKSKMKSGLRSANPDLQAIERFIDCDKFTAAYEEFLGSCDSNTTWATWLINYSIAFAYWMNENAQHFEANQVGNSI